MVLTVERVNRMLSVFKTEEGRLHHLLKILPRIGSLPSPTARHVGTLINKYAPVVVDRYLDRARYDLAMDVFRATHTEAFGAEILTKNGHYSHASVLWDEAGKHEEGAREFLKRKAPWHAAILLERGGFHKKAGLAAFKAHEYVWAASLFEEANEHRLAGIAYEQIGKLKEARAAYAKINGK